MTKATCRRKCLFGDYGFDGLESMTIMVGSVASGRQAWCWEVAEISILRHIHKTETDRQVGR